MAPGARLEGRRKPSEFAAAAEGKKETRKETVLTYADETDEEGNETIDGSGALPSITTGSLLTIGITLGATFVIGWT